MNDNQNYMYQVAPFMAPRKGTRTVIAYYVNEVYKPYPPDPRFLVSDYGNVYDTATRTKLIPSSTGRYLEFSINGVSTLAHRMVMLTFSPNPSTATLQVNHINGVRWDNRYSDDPTKTNLEWCTAQENAAHAARTGLFAVGDRNAWTNWPDEVVHTICRFMQAGFKPREIAAMINVPYSDNFCNFISKLRTGECRRNITRNYIFPKDPEYTEEQVHLICQKIAEDQMSFEEIAQWVSEMTHQFVHPNFVRTIRYRNTKKWRYIIDQYQFPRKHHSKETIEIICSLLERGFTTKQIAEYLGIPYDESLIRTTTCLRNGRLWPEITKKYNIPKAYRRYSNPEIHLVCQEWKKGTSDERIAEKLGYPYDAAFKVFLSRLANREMHTDITSIYFPIK